MSDDSRPAPPAANNNGTSSTEPASNSQAHIRKKFATQTKRKADFIHDIMFNLDLLIYAEICVLYYMEYVFPSYVCFCPSNAYINLSCSFFRFLLRVLFQVMFLTPKPKFVPPALKHRPYIGAILGCNIICMLLQLFTR